MIKDYDKVTILPFNIVVATPTMMSCFPIPLIEVMVRLYEYFSCPPTQLSPWVVLIYERVQLLKKYFGVPFALPKLFGLFLSMIR